MKKIVSTFFLGLMVVTPLLASADDILTDELILLLGKNKELRECLEKANDDRKGAEEQCDKLDDEPRDECLEEVGINHAIDIYDCLDASQRRSAGRR
jgi:hypothetical protein